MGELNCCQKKFSPEIELHTGASTNDSSYNIEKKDQKINNKLNSEKDKQIISLQNKINEYMKMLNNKNNIITKLQSEVEILRNKDSKKNNPKKKSKGLDNIGATCYMNATLQCLSNTKKLREYFETKYNNSSNKTMSNEFFKLIYHLFNENDSKKSYSPYPFKEALSKENPLFAGVQANDSKDLINFLLERMHQETNVIDKKVNNIDNNYSIKQQDQTNEQLMLALFLEEFTQKFNSPISNLFYGLLETKTQCKGCNVIKFNFQVYSFLEFPLQQVNLYFYNLGKRPLVLENNKNPDIDLLDCFEYNKKIDLMNGENQMYCNICNRLCDALYSTELYSAPNYLIINLNRGKGAVYECNVNFPEELNIVNYLSFKNFNTVFNLYAVICHLGPSSMSGHFVAYVRNNEDYKWYLYNDSIVTECTKPFQYREGMPYILFYKVLKGGPNLPF
jgi:ubiquitin C-terminal hydrolase